MVVRHLVVHDASELASHRAAWQDLLRASDADPLFMSYEWLTTWWRHLSSDGDLLVYLIYADDRLVGIVPLLRRLAEGFRQLVPLGIGNADYVDFILDPAYAEACTGHLLEHALPETPGWDVLYVPNLVERNATAASLSASARRPSRYRVEIRDFDIGPYLPIEGTWADYRATHLKKRLVKDTERQERRLKREFGQVTLRTASTPQDVHEWYEHLVHHHKVRRDDVKDDFSMFNDARHVAFYRDLAVQGLSDGSLHFTALFVGEAIAALHMGFVKGGVYYYLLPVFDDEFARYSPGRILTHALLDECFSGSFERFDFGYGDEPYKYEYTASRRLLKVAVIANDTLRGNLASVWFNNVRPTMKNSTFFMETVLPKIKARQTAALRA